MKIHRSALGLVLLVSLSMAKTIPTSEPISSGTEKEALGQDAPPAPTKREVPEVPAEIAVEAAQEPKQADRAKKSATTTFCVEIRPGPSDGPVKACDEHNPLPPSPPPSSPSQSEPQIPNNGPPQELHQQSHHEEHEQLSPFFVLPPNPLALYIPNEGQSTFVNCPPHIVHHNNQVQAPGNTQHIIIPPPASFPYPSLPSSSQHIIIPSSGSATYPSIASSSAQHLIIPSTSGSPQHIVIPSTAGSGLCPCQSATSSNGIYPQTLISLFRSAMARNGEDNMSPASMDPAMAMEMRSGSGGPGDWLNGINSGSMLTEGSMEPSNQMPYGSESLDTPFARTHTKKIYAVPIGSYYGSGAGYQAKSPYVVQCNPQVLALGGASGGGGSTLVLNSGTFRDADGNSNTNNMENGAGKIDQSMHMNEAPMNLGTPQAGRHVIHPIVQPIIHTTPGASFHSTPGVSFHSSPTVYQHSSTYQTYQSRPGIYPSHDSGYMVHPGSHFYRREGAPPQQLRSWNNGNIQQNPSSDMEMQRQQQQQFEGKSWNPQAGNMERTSSSDMSNTQQQQRGQGANMSPSQMLNQMRGVGSNPASGSSSSFGRTSPVMQSFPREHEESSPCKEGVHVNMHIPSGGQPFMITSPRNRDDKNMSPNHGGAMHDEMGKREAEKSSVSEIDA